MRECACGRGEYDPEKYWSCYECYLDRRASYVDCIWCGRWHSPSYPTCYVCRAIPDRDDVTDALRQDILMRDDYKCQKCGSHEQPEVDFIKPCATTGLARPWNLHVLCHACNQRKGTGYDKSWTPYRIALAHLYLTFGWCWLDGDQQAALVAEVAGMTEFGWHAHVSPPGDVPAWAAERADCD